MKPIEVICPNSPKAARVRAEKAEDAAKNATKRTTRAGGWRWLSLTKEEAVKLAAHMVTWFIDNPEADNLWDYLLNREPYSPSQIYRMKEECLELADALNFVYALIAARAQKGWKEVNAAKYYEKMFQTFSPELKELMKEQAKLAKDVSIENQFRITHDPMGMLAPKKEEE